MEKTRILDPNRPAKPPKPLRTDDPDEMLAMYLVARARDGARDLSELLSDERRTRVRGHVNRLLALDGATRHALLTRTFGDAEDAQARAAALLARTPIPLRQATYSALPPHVRDRLPRPTSVSADRPAHRLLSARSVLEALRA